MLFTLAELPFLPYFTERRLFAPSAKSIDYTGNCKMYTEVYVLLLIFHTFSSIAGAGLSAFPVFENTGDYP